MTRYTLTYFDMRGRAEPVRLVLSYVGADFEDRGISADDWPAMKPTTPLGQIPVLVEHGPSGDRAIPQTMAIMRHLARSHGIDGKTEEERTAADVAIETALDLRNALNTLRFSPAWQDDGAKQKFARETAPVHLGRLVKLLGERSWFASAEPTHADLYVFDVLERHTAVWPDILSAQPSLGAFQARVAALPQLRDYLAKRRPA
jgi:glutathione S-transferase